MSSFIVTAPTPSIEELPIVAGPFWPEIAPSTMRDEFRIDTTFPAVRLRATLIEAIASVNGELRAWREQQQANGYNHLNEVPADEIDEKSVLEHRYIRAIGNLAKALLLERVPDFDSTASGDKKADRQCDPIDDLRRDHRHAISDILGVGRSTVELI